MEGVPEKEENVPVVTTTCADCNLPPNQCKQMPRCRETSECIRSLYDAFVKRYPDVKEFSVHMPDAGRGKWFFDLMKHTHIEEHRSDASVLTLAVTARKPNEVDVESWMGHGSKDTNLVTRPYNEKDVLFGLPEIGGSVLLLWNVLECRSLEAVCKILNAAIERYRWVVLVGNGGKQFLAHPGFEDEDGLAREFRQRSTQPGSVAWVAYTNLSWDAYPLCAYDTQPFRGSKYVSVIKSPVRLHFRGFHCAKGYTDASYADTDFPTVTIAIIAKNAARYLPTFLAKHINQLDYPHSRIHVWIRTNNNNDKTTTILSDWACSKHDCFASVTFDATDIPDVQFPDDNHDWTVERFKVLGRIRQESIEAAIKNGSDFYYCIDVDNFVDPRWLKQAVELNIDGVIAPYLRVVEEPGRFYSNFHADIDQNGYYKHCATYESIVKGELKGLVQVPVVHCSYLIPKKYLPLVSYLDRTPRHEYVVFSESCRKQGISQYLDCRRCFGFLTFIDDAKVKSDPSWEKKWEKASAFLNGLPYL